MKTYLTIQYKRFNRISIAKGIHPALNVLLILLVFLGLSFLIYAKVTFANYAYAFIGLGLIAYSSGHERTDFLQQCFKPKQFRSIRILENTSLAIPFIAFLIYKNEPLYLIASFLFFAIIAAIIQFPTKLTIALPTPFGRFPFEFTRGFRRMILVHLTLIFFTYFSIEANNYNLGLFLLLVNYLVVANYYSFIEPIGYLWIFKHSPSQFIKEKMKTIMIYSFLPGLPITVLLIVFFPSYYWVTLLGLIVGMAYVGLFMFAKYANYPAELSIKDGFIIVGCILFPPFMLIVIPMAYFRSIHSLSKILHD